MASVSEMNECDSSSRIVDKGVVNNGGGMSNYIPLVASTPMSRANHYSTLDSDTTNNDSSVFVEIKRDSSFDSEDSSDNQISSSTRGSRRKKSRRGRRAPTKSLKKSTDSYSSDDNQEFVSCDDTPFEDTSLKIGNDSSVLIVEQNMETGGQVNNFTAEEKRLHTQYRIAEQQFRRVLRRRMSEDAIPSIASIEVIKSQPLESAYNRQKEAFEMANVPTNEIFVYHMGMVSEQDKVEIIENNLKVANTSGYSFGRGIYFSEYPEQGIGYSKCGLLLCKVTVSYTHLRAHET